MGLIASIVVSTEPAHEESVAAALAAVDGCEVHFRDGRGKIVATIDRGEDPEAPVAAMESLRDLPHVLSVDLAGVYGVDPD